MWNYSCCRMRTTRPLAVVPICIWGEVVDLWTWPGGGGWPLILAGEGGWPLTLARGRWLTFDPGQGRWLTFDPGCREVVDLWPWPGGRWLIYLPHPPRTGPPNPHDHVTYPMMHLVLPPPIGVEQTDSCEIITFARFTTWAVISDHGKRLHNWSVITSQYHVLVLTSLYMYKLCF